MKVLYGYRGAKYKLKAPVAAIGIFDGVHIGHKKVIKKLLNSTGKDKVIATFDPHPKKVLFPKKPSLRIMSLDHRLSIFEKMGLDAVIVIRFSRFIAEMSPEDFVKRILLNIGAKKIYVGRNFYFGCSKSGDIERLKEIGKKYGIDVCVVGHVKRKGKIVSSTWLRSLISLGKLKDAEKLLRRPVSVLGTVVTGDNRGKTLGVPTANIDPHHEVIPPPGIYAVFVCFEGKIFEGVLNVGFNPTFYGRSLKRRREPKIEVNLFDFDDDIYGCHMEIFFMEKLRKEKKFRSVEKLKIQIKKDILAAKKALAGRDVRSKIETYKRY
ncbi:MAG: bifunctional riboflavin kinase/FAD synthetase [Candidatus Omnitrophica bacterium]|nr:bifunctional riboflavin kinase/FAD synthetase [Candidatus Omnitrophota bacterium]